MPAQPPQSQPGSTGDALSAAREEIIRRRRDAAALTDDEWQAFSRHEAAKAIGAWLEARKKLGVPVASLTMGDLEGLVERAINRWIVLASERLADAPEKSEKIGLLLMG